MSRGHGSDNDPALGDDAALRRLLGPALDGVVPPTPDPARARFRRVRPPGDLALRVEILVGDLLPAVRRTAAMAGVVVLVGSLALTPAVAHDLGLTGETGEIGGVVTDTTGEPLPGALVRVLPTSEARIWWHARALAARSGADGRFALAGVPSGLVVLRASAPGSVAQTIADVEVAVGRSTEAAFALAPRSAGTVGGSIKDEQGAPLPGALVRLSPRRGHDRAAWSPLEASPFDMATRPDASGSFRFERVPVGEYVASASLDGFGADVRFGVTVSPDRESQVDLVLTRIGTATLTGRVRSAATGAAVAGARVFSFVRSGARGAAQQAGADGTFTLSVPADEVVLGVVAPAFRSELSGPYRLEAGTTLRVEVTLQAISGDAQPLADPRLRFLTGTPAPLRTARPSAPSDAPTPTPGVLPGSMGGGSWTGGSWGGWRPAASATPTASPRHR